MTAIETKSIDTIRIIVENDNGVDYVHVTRSDVDTLNKDAFLFAKGDAAGGLKFLNSISELIGVGTIIRNGQ